MRTWMTSFALGATLLASTSVSAAVTTIAPVDVDNTSGGVNLDGFVTSDINIDFTGQWTGSQLIINLDSGSFYRDAIGNADGSAPNPVLFSTFPSLEFDTYVIGNPGGGAIDLVGGVASATFPTSGSTTLDQAWNSAAGVAIIDQSDFLTARITLSDDATGTWSYLASVDGDLTKIEGNTITNGSLTVVPEPASLALLSLASLGFLTRRRRMA